MKKGTYVYLTWQQKDGSTGFGVTTTDEDEFGKASVAIQSNGKLPYTIYCNVTWLTPVKQTGV